MDRSLKETMKADMADWYWSEVTIGGMSHEEFLELKKMIWEDMKKSEEGMLYWQKRIEDEAEFARELRDRARGITDRIKQSAREKSSST